jgi:S-adenosylmethionine:tRNA ribosyltransferase-isomerase
MNQHPGDLSIASFTYPLPDDRIARFPLEERDASRLLIYKNQKIQDSIFRNLPDLFSKGDLLIFNQTRVVQARLHFQTQTGAAIEVFCLEPVGDITIPMAMLQQGSADWLCMVGNAKKWKLEEVLQLSVNQEKLIFIEVQLLEKRQEGYVVRFSWKDPVLCFADILDQAGFLPLPPYLKRDVQESDKSRYQTVYADQKGSVAAPTAGLHFTPEVFEQLKSRGVECKYLTLHVGAGTFKPVKAEKMSEHDMHSEEVIATLELIESVAACEGKIACVGTTTLRTLESLYWTAVRLMEHPETACVIEVNQWDPYETRTSSLPDRKQAFQFLAQVLKARGLDLIQGETKIIIAPGYTIRVIDALVTNFHQPQSTLLLLVSACIGDIWKEVYTHALEHDYRFLSYGDSSVLFLK